jgi:Rod binding domain-containing protein
MSLALGPARTAVALPEPVQDAAQAISVSAPPHNGKAEKAARDFEAVMLATLLEPLQKSFGGSLEDGSIGSGEYGSMGTQALATAMAERGGIGIARLVLRHLEDTKVPTSQGTGVPARL